MKRDGRNGVILHARAALTVLLALLECGCTSQSPPRAEIIRPVKTMVVTAGEDTRTRSFPGKVEASRRVELALQVPGVLVDFPVKEGQTVAKGDIIGQLRPDEFQARLT